MRNGSSNPDDDADFSHPSIISTKPLACPSVAVTKLAEADAFQVLAKESPAGVVGYVGVAGCSPAVARWPEQEDARTSELRTDDGGRGNFRGLQHRGLVA